MKKIYICGLAASGKGLMKQLLDGHSKLCMVPFQGFILKSLMTYDFVSITSNPRFLNPYRTEYFKYMPFFNIVEGNSVYKINFDEFARNIYYNYDLYIASRSKRLWGEAGKGVESLVEFQFDYPRFEEDWFNALFAKQVNISIEEFLDVMYDCFINNWKNKYIISKDVKAVFTTVQNGIAPINWLLKNTANSKLLLMERNGVGFSYAMASKHAVRSKEYPSLYNLSLINSLKEYRRVIYSDEIRSNPRLLIVDFDKLVLDTHNTMIKVAEFLEMEYEDILIKATINTVPLESGGVRFTGKINENPYESLPQSALDFLEYLYYGPDAKDGRCKQFYLFARASKQKILHQVSLWGQRFQRLIEYIRRD